MASERVSKFQETPARALTGMNERISPTAYQPGQFDLVRGLYAARNGLLQRIPPHSLLAAGYGKVLKIHPTGNTNGVILIQDANGIHAVTLDEILNRATVPNITFPPLTEEESMSLAIIVQTEPNARDGGSMQGYYSGTDSTSAANTNYGRRLTDMLVNEASTVVSFTASTGGSGAASTAGQFVLAPGTYRITGSFTFGRYGAATCSYIASLYNVTDARTEYYSATGASPSTSTPIVARATYLAGTTTDANLTATIDAQIVVATSNKTFQINQACSNATDARSTIAGGRQDGLAGSLINGAAATATYAHIKILKVA